MRIARLLGCTAAVALLCLACGCPPLVQTHGGPSTIPAAARLEAIDLSDAAQPTLTAGLISLAAARNEWTNFAVRLALPAPVGYRLALRAPLSAAGGISIASFEAFQILPMPIDMDRAGYVRHTGQETGHQSLSRALLPQSLSADGILALDGLRNPAVPADPRSRAGGPGSPPVLLWFDVHVPPNAHAGQYDGAIDLLGAAGARPLASIPLRLEVYDFALPDERHLQMVGQLGWDRLAKLLPEQFSDVTPAWVNRREDRYSATVRTLDHLAALAHRNRVSLVIPALRPIVKWPADGDPRVDWGDFDSMVRPWLSGDAFGDHVGLRFWPLPEAELLDRYNRASQLEYWREATRHFAQNDWLKVTAAVLPSPDARSAGTGMQLTEAGAQLTPADCAKLSADAGELLRSCPGLRVLAPLEESQIELASKEHPGGIAPSDAARVLAASPGRIEAAPAHAWPADVAKPEHWLRTDLPGLVPYAGAGGDERDVRVWAWLAFLRRADPPDYGHLFDPNFIFWSTTLPGADAPDRPADPTEMTWFYPGRWFGVDAPVPTIQLKWLRRAQQDYEYLLLAQDRGEVANALLMARLIAKPVQLARGQAPDPIYGLLGDGMTRLAWREAHALLAQTILLRTPGETPDAERSRALYIRTLQWASPLQRPVLLCRDVTWSLAAEPADPRNPGTWVNLQLGLDIYNASGTTPDQNRLGWSAVPPGWDIHPPELILPRLEPFHILRATLHQRFNLDRVGPADRQPIELQFIDGFTRNAYPLRIVLPVAASDRRAGRTAIDGALDEWSDADALQDGPMVRMLNRPAVARQALQQSSTCSKIYTAWDKENFYVAFALQGVTPDLHHSRNFVEYQQRRAWGEDLCELLIQPIGADNAPGPVLHVVCKPNGSTWVERKAAADALGGQSRRDLWKDLNGAGVHYAALMPPNAWQGEVAIPWSAIVGEEGRAPSLLRFNFIQHKAATGESASWAGPIDFGPDQAIMGLLYLRDPAPGEAE